MQRRTFLQTAAGALCAAAATPGQRPNIVLIYADDIGYGDLSCYGATKVRTPNLDRLAAQGMRFTNAHSSSATCTPSRYSMITGEYAWRKPGTGVLPGDARLILDTGKANLASLLKKAGYRTGVVGKWHLGLGDGNLDWNGEIKPGPREVGFDYSFIIPATGDRVPCVYVENSRVAGLDPSDPIRVSYREPVGDEPTGNARPDLLKMKLTHGHDMTIVNGISRIGYMTGGKSARWVDEDMADVITGKAEAFLKDSRRDPFFLYFATHDIHVPRVPHPRFAGKTICGPRCDVINQLDDSVGRIVNAIDAAGLAKQTLILFSSDNGPVLDDGYADRAVEALNGHMPAGVLRGGKYSIYEAGTRVPFLARWSGVIRPGKSEALISQVDLPATAAELAGQELQADEAPDSISFAPTLLGKKRDARQHLVEHAGVHAIRTPRYKLIPNSPGAEGRGKAKEDKGPELYDLEKDPAEGVNRASDRPDLVQVLKGYLDDTIRSGRSR